MNKKGKLTLLAAGTTRVDRAEPETIFAYSAPTLREADIAYCEVEGTFSERGSINPVARAALRAHPRNAKALKYAGFHVASFAGNHSMDWGVDAFLDTIEVLKQQGIAVVGAGSDIEESRKPAIIEKKGTKVAFLAYASMAPYGYWADTYKPGCAPMKAFTVYEPIQHDEPESPLRKIYSFAHPEDLELMKQDVRKAKEQADVVVAAFHWGLHLVRAKLAMYQKEVAHAAIDAGADLILGGHPHILKGVEVYKGKAIFHALGDFAFDLDFTKVAQGKIQRHFQEVIDSTEWKPDPEWASTYPFMPESRMVVIAKCIISDGQITKVSFLPVLINKQSQPAVLSPESDDFHKVASYMQAISEEAGLTTRFRVEGKEVVVSLD